MLKVNLANRDGKQAHFEPYEIINGDTSSVESLALSVISVAQSHGTFKAITRTTAGTSIITTPTSKGSIVLTDLLVTSDKKPAATVTIRFTDDTNTVNLIIADATNNTVNLGHSFTGLVQGWQDARVEIVTTTDTTATITCVYYKTKEALDFIDWDARR